MEERIEGIDKETSELDKKISELQKKRDQVGILKASGVEEWTAKTRIQFEKRILKNRDVKRIFNLTFLSFFFFLGMWRQTPNHREPISRRGKGGSNGGRHL